MGRSAWRAVVAGTLIAAAVGGPAGLGSASTTTRVFRVNSQSDAHDAHPGDGICADTAGACTLRAAIEEADASAPGTSTTIEVPDGLYVLTLGSLDIGRSGTALTITIDGDDSEIDAGHRSRVIDVESATTATLSGLTVTGGDAGSGFGGGIFNAGDLTLFDTDIVQNRADSGGGILNQGSLVVAESGINYNNGGRSGGGGIENGGPLGGTGTVRVVSSTVDGNVTTYNGGGIADDAAAAAPSRPFNVVIIDSEVSGNVGGNGGGAVAAGAVEILDSHLDHDSAGGAVGGALFGGGIVQGSTMIDNSASSGGAIEVFPNTKLTVSRSTLSGNVAQSDGGAIDLSGDVTITHSTLADNIAGGRYLGTGAAAELAGGASLTLTDSTVVGNRTNPAGGGAINNYGGSAQVAYDTFADNQAGAFAGGGFTTLTATIVSTAESEPGCVTPIHETVGYNLDSGKSCDFAVPTDQSGVDARLGSLRDNGGPTQTEALLPGSPAIDRGGSPSASGCPLTDQRGDPRPWGPACDVGAFELQYPV